MPIKWPKKKSEKSRVVEAGSSAELNQRSEPAAPLDLEGKCRKARRPLPQDPGGPWIRTHPLLVPHPDTLPHLPFLHALPMISPSAPPPFSNAAVYGFFSRWQYAQHKSHNVASIPRNSPPSYIVTIDLTSQAATRDNIHTTLPWLLPGNSGPQSFFQNPI